MKPIERLEQGDMALLTDLYQLTMLQAYWAEGMRERALFSLHFRDLPPHRNFMLACGQGELLETIRQLRFSRQHLDELANAGPFRDDFLRHLEDFRFTGDVHAMPEGTPVFPHEPLMEIEAPVGEGQLLESLIMNQVHVQSVLASAAIRFRLVAGDALSIVDFGMRRSHGFDAAVQGVRAYWIAGLDATSNVLGGIRYGVPVRGTMAHSYIQSHDDEQAAFEAFADLYPDTTLLVDTYDSMRGLDRAIALAREGRIRFGAIRLDSGDLLALSKQARQMLDAAGLDDVSIFVSGGLNEYSIAGLLDGGAPIAGCGVGSCLAVSAESPSLELTYKLTEYAGAGRTKTSPGKRVYPGAKQVFRCHAGSADIHDVLAGRHEKLDGTPLLRQVMKDGEIVDPAFGDHHSARDYTRQAVAALPDAVKALTPASRPYEVRVSAWLGAELDKVISRSTR